MRKRTNRVSSIKFNKIRAADAGVQSTEYLTFIYGDVCVSRHLCLVKNLKVRFYIW